MCNNGSGRHKVCSYYVIKTICVFPKQEEARWEGGEEKKEQKKSQDWRYRACVGSRKLRLIQLSHKKPRKMLYEFNHYEMFCMFISHVICQYILVFKC